MKSAALCVFLLLLSLLCHSASCISLKGNEMVNSAADNLADAQVEASYSLAPLLRSKRQSHMSICVYCCNCCKQKVCGFCCRT
ncbi:hypothetical protein FKM82_013041 [Ascaphus truei]